MHANELSAIALFSGLDEPTLAMLAARLPTQAHEAGAIVFREGDQGRAMYVVIAGAVDIDKTGPRGSEVRLTSFGPGEWFGENSLVDVMSRSCTARASEPTQLLVLKPTDLELVYRTDAKMYAMLVMNIARQLSRKLRKAEAALADR